jgi:arabinogalactan endo-1,4-beta-galactosidase
MRRVYLVLAALFLWSCGESEHGDPSGAAGSGSGTAGTAATPGSAGAGASAGTTGSAGTGASAGTTGAAGTAAGTAGTAGGGGAAAGRGGSGGSAGAAGGAGGGAAGTGGAAGRGGTAGSATAGTGGAAGRGGAGGSAASAGTGGGAAGRGGATGSAGTGGAAGTLPFSFYIGADITDQEPQPAATRANLLTIMKSHGFNYIRLRTFVDPRAADGYDKANGWGGIVPTVAFGKQVKDAGMGLLIDFHYADNWADPAKQCVPPAWQGYTTIAQLATAVHDYTRDSINMLIAGGARPDMVQIGNESTPGILVHRCDSGGIPLQGVAGINPVNGALYYYSERDPNPPAGAPPVGGWTNLGMLLKAGAQAVKEIDPGIVNVLHLDRGNDLASSRNFIQNAITQGVPFEVYGNSCYTSFQGPPSGWQSVFSSLATQFPSLKFIIAEYGPDQRPANDIMWNMANQRGLGTFNWAPTQAGFWNEPNHDLLRRSGSTYNAQPDLAFYDQMKIDYASRL